MLNTLTILPAYGRKYANMAEALKDWESGKDFYIHEMGCYCSIRDTLEFKRQMYYVNLRINKFDHKVI